MISWRDVRHWLAAQASVSIDRNCRLVPAAEFSAALGQGWVSCVAREGADVRDYRPFLLSAPLPTRETAFGEASYAAEPLRLFAIPGARFYGPSGYFADRYGRLVRESIMAWDSKSSERTLSMRQVRRRLGPAARGTATRLAGTFVLAAGAFEANYGHWHADLLPAVALARSVLPDGFKVLIAEDSDFVRKSLDLMGIGPERIARIPRDRPLMVETLVVGSMQRNVGLRIHPAVGDVYGAIKSGVISSPAVPPHRRIFASRGASTRRALTNRAELERRIRDMGFEIALTQELSYEDQIATFHQADIVVGEHGAALTNIGFCQPGALVVELCHPVNNELTYLSLSRITGLRHAFFVGRRGPGREHRGAAWDLDIDEALAFTEKAIEERARRAKSLKPSRD